MIVSWLLVIPSVAQEVKETGLTGKIAFCQRDGKYWQIWIMNLDGSNKKKLTDSPVDKRSPDFSSDGQKIVFVTNEGALWVINSDASSQEQIPLNISAAEPKWCFDEEKIIFTSYRGLYFLDDSDIWIVNSDGSGLQKIVRRPSLQFLPRVSSNRKELLFVDVLEISSHEIFSMDLETNDFRQLTDNAYHDTDPVFLPDNSAVAYACDKDGNYDIWIMDIYGRDPLNLSKHPAFDASPVISGDGKTIFFLSDRKGGMQIWSMGLEGNNLKQITNDKEDKQDICVYTNYH